MSVTTEPPGEDAALSLGDGRGPAAVFRRVRPMAVMGAFLVLFAVLGGALASCNYSFRAGAGFPDYIRTVAVLPFENETSRFELTDNLYQELQEQLPRALGLQQAGEEVADAVVRGAITGYDVSTPNYRSSDAGAAQVLQREVLLRVQIQIVDLQQGLILWEDRGLSARGQYLEASETEDVAVQEAIELLVQSVVDGAQSNW